MNNEKHFEEMQKRIDEEKARVKSGEITSNNFNAWLCGFLSGDLAGFYNGKMLNIFIDYRGGG